MLLGDVEDGKVVGVAAVIYCCLMDKADASRSLWSVEFLWERNEQSVRTVGAGDWANWAPLHTLTNRKARSPFVSYKRILVLVAIASMAAPQLLSESFFHSSKNETLELARREFGVARGT